MENNTPAVHVSSHFIIFIRFAGVARCSRSPGDLLACLFRFSPEGRDSETHSEVRSHKEDMKGRHRNHDELSWSVGTTGRWATAKVRKRWHRLGSCGSSEVWQMCGVNDGFSFLRLSIRCNQMIPRIFDQDLF